MMFRFMALLNITKSPVEATKLLSDVGTSKDLLKLNREVIVLI